MTDSPQNKPQNRAELFEFTVFLATSARGAVEEGVFTASYRLVDAIRRLLAIFPYLEDDPFFAEIADVTGDRFRSAYLRSEADYLKALDEIVACAAREIRRRTEIGLPA